MYQRKELILHQLKALLVDKEQDRTIDKCAVYDFLSLLAVPAPNTLFQNIKNFRLAPAWGEPRWKDKKKHRYWDICDYAKEENGKENEAEIADELLRLLVESAQIRKDGDVAKVGVQLQGNRFQHKSCFGIRE